MCRSTRHQPQYPVRQSNNYSERKKRRSASPVSIRLDRDGIYGEIKRELIKRGIPAHEIAFIHDFKTPAEKARAFADANAGKIRVMIASTKKAGAGTNMQERLAALHHLDGPWRPSDVEQREGRILRCPFTGKLAYK